LAKKESTHFDILGRLEIEGENSLVLIDTSAKLYFLPTSEELANSLLNDVKSLKNTITLK